jgi:hypothetical protein
MAHQLLAHADDICLFGDKRAIHRSTETLLDTNVEQGGRDIHRLYCFLLLGQCGRMFEYNSRRG